MTLYALALMLLTAVADEVWKPPANPDPSAILREAQADAQAKNYETALAKLLESTPWEIGASIAPHPTVSESVKEAALAVDGVAIHI